MKTHIDEMIFDIADAIQKANEFDRIMTLPNCNNCGKVKECEYAPKPGERVRINCALWEGRDEQKGSH